MCACVRVSLHTCDSAAASYDMGQLVNDGSGGGVGGDKSSSVFASPRRIQLATHTDTDTDTDTRACPSESCAGGIEVAMCEGASGGAESAADRGGRRVQSAKASSESVPWAHQHSVGGRGEGKGNGGITSGGGGGGGSGSKGWARVDAFGGGDGGVCGWGWGKEKAVKGGGTKGGVCSHMFGRGGFYTSYTAGACACDVWRSQEMITCSVRVLGVSVCWE